MVHNCQETYKQGQGYTQRSRWTGSSVSTKRGFNYAYRGNENQRRGERLG